MVPILSPARRVHVDGDISGAQMQEFPTAKQIIKFLSRPYAVLNVWRKDPLAVLDTRTLQRGDMVRGAFIIFGRKEKDVIENVGIKSLLIQTHIGGTL